MDLSSAAVEQAIIGTMQKFNRPIRPGTAVSNTLFRHLSGSSKKFRRNYRRSLLSVTGDDIRRVSAEILEPAYKKASICVLSSREELEKANQEMEKQLTVIEL